VKVCIVGGGLGALRSAEALVNNGFAGHIQVVSDEIHMPYNRPPLSKEAISGSLTVADLEFKRKASTENVEWVLGDRAVSSDFSQRSVTLASGKKLEWDGLVIATGIRPLRLNLPHLPGRFAVRTFEDSLGLRKAIAAAQHVVIVGAGFIGCEVAATCAKMQKHTTVIGRHDLPMLKSLGHDLAADLKQRHMAHEVNFRSGVEIVDIQGQGQIESVTLSDGTELRCDVLVEAIGSEPNCEWLSDNNLDLTDGVMVNSAMVVDHEAPVVAVGDIARYVHGYFDPRPRRVEHWNLPTDTAKRAGKSLVQLVQGEVVDATRVDFLPAFWSDQYDMNIQAYGLPGLANRTEMVQGSWGENLIVEYRRDDFLVGVIGINSIPQLMPYRQHFVKALKEFSAST